MHKLEPDIYIWFLPAFIGTVQSEWTVRYFFTLVRQKCNVLYNDIFIIFFVLVVHHAGFLLHQDNTVIIAGWACWVGIWPGPALQQAGMLTPELRRTLPQLRHDLKWPKLIYAVPWKMCLLCIFVWWHSVHVLYSTVTTAKVRFFK